MLTRFQVPECTNVDENFVDTSCEYLNSTSFTQSLSSELGLNNLFNNWTTDNPDNFTLIGETGNNPEVTQRGSGELNAIPIGNTGSANLYSTSTNFRPLLIQDLSASISVGDWLEISAICSAGVFADNISIGRVDIDSTTNPVFIRFTSTGTQYGLEQCTTQSIRFNPITSPIDATFDSFSVKKLTLNAVDTVLANGLYRFQFNFPVTTFGGQKIALIYRRQDSSNYFKTVVYRDRRNTSWYLSAYKVTAGVVSNMGGFDGNDIYPISDSTNTLEVTTSGETHRFYVTEGIVRRQILNGINDSSFTSETGMQIIYSKDIIPVRRMMLGAC